MTGAPLYLGDAFSAAGYALAGAQVRVPEPGAETQAFEQACAQAALVLVSAAVAAHIDAQVLRRASAAPSPLVLVTPDPQGKVVLPELAGRLRVQLGLDA